MSENIMKDMARILAIGQLVGPEAAKEMIGNLSKKSIIEATVIAIKRLSDAQKEELKKQEDTNSATTSTTASTDTTNTTNNKQSRDTSESGENPQPEINDTVEISQNAQKALKTEAISI